MIFILTTQLKKEALDTWNDYLWNYFSTYEVDENVVLGVFEKYFDVVMGRENVEQWKTPKKFDAEL